MRIDQSKSALREICVGRRRAAFEQCDQTPAQERLVAHISAIPTINIVSGYFPIRSEIDPMPAMVSLHEHGFQLCLPVVLGEGKSLEFRAWQPGAAMQPGVFGAMIPESTEAMEPEAVITPLLAFDAEGRRLGYGGGYYDRSLEELRARRRTYAIGLAFEVQRVDVVPDEATDQRLDAVVTEVATILPA